jgi:glycosyltransferase involved in cell wall biosynthesis
VKPRAVLYVANAAKIGGGNRVFIDLIQNLDTGRFVPYLVSPARGPMTEWASAAGIPYSISEGGDWYGVSGLARLSRRAIGFAWLIRSIGADIVHAAAPTCYRSLGVAARLTRAARVCHLGFPPEPGELQRAFVSGPEAVIGCYEGQASEHADLIRSINPSCRVVGIPNGVDTVKFSAGSAAAPDVLALRRGHGTAVAILGHISDVKGYGAFIEAAAAVARRHDCSFFAVGGETTQQGARARFERRVAEFDLQDRFHFLGAREDVADVLRSMDIVCLPSLAEGLPLAVLEAMATGLPVVATPVGGVPEAIVDGETGLLVPPEDSAALSYALDELIASPERMHAMGAAARLRAERRFSIRVFADSVQDVYESLRPAPRLALRPQPRNETEAVL